MSFHDEHTGTDNHGPYAAVFADADERINDSAAYLLHQSAAGGSNPVRALQLDTATEWYLASILTNVWLTLTALFLNIKTATFG